MSTGERQVAIRTADICEACAAGAAASTVPYKMCAACTAKVMTIEQAEAEIARLERDAAISLLIEAPVDCSDRASLPGRCGTCWTCRVDKFLRDAGVRR